jgi:DnaK suppressor protein
MLRDLRQRLQDARDEWTSANQVRDTADSSELHGREDIELELLRLKVDTLERINEALSRVQSGTYGLCADCKGTIPGPRLRALPFAARCKECEETRERIEPTARPLRFSQRISASVDGISDRDAC